MPVTKMRSARIKILVIGVCGFTILGWQGQPPAAWAGVDQNAMIGGQLDAMTSNPLPESSEVKPSVMDGAYLVVSLSYLSNYKLHYTYPDSTQQDLSLPGEATIARVNRLIPEAIRSLDGKKVEVKGFLIPVELQGQKPTTFVITHSPTGCCFGVAPRMNGWIYISTTAKTKNQANADEPYRPVTVYGTLHIGLHVHEDQTVTLYRIDAEKVIQSEPSS